MTKIKAGRVAPAASVKAVRISAPNEEDAERLILAHSPLLKAILEKSRQSIKEGKGLTHEAFWKAVKARRGKAK